MAQRIDNPFPLFLNDKGDLLFGGKVFVGVAGQDPEANPLATFWDEGLTIAAAQPFQVLGGLIHNGDSPAFVFADGDDYSIRVRDADDEIVFYVPSIKVTGQQYQPLSSTLTALAALTTTAYGRGLLLLANQAALRAATGIPDPLPLAGGTVTGNITRSGAGVHLYHAAGAMVSGRVFLTDHDAADPTSLVGDIWLKRAAP
jgi:hypothetical protein